MSEADARSPSAHILLVEDEALIAIGIVDYMTELGAQVTWSSTVADALSAIDQPPPIDLAIVDLNLGGELSIPIIDRLLGNGTATILCTGYDLSSIEDRYRSLPRAEKPFTRARIRTVLSDYL